MSVAIGLSCTEGSPWDNKIDEKQGLSRPSKIRRCSPDEFSCSAAMQASSATSEDEPAQQNQRSESVRVKLFSDAHTNMLGFSPNEFLPFDFSINKNMPDRSKKVDPRIAELSDEVFGRCLWSGYLDTLETVQLTAVCKRWQVMASLQVQRLDLNRCKKLTPSNISTIVRRFPKIQELNLNYCPQVEPKHIFELVPLTNSLKELHLKGTQVSDKDMTSFLDCMSSMNENKRCSLEVLDLSTIDENRKHCIGDNSLQAITAHCPQLRVLRVAWCKNISDRGLFFIKGLSNLQELDLSLTGITDSSIDTLYQMLHNFCPLLSRLNIGGTQISGTKLLNGLTPQLLFNSSVHRSFPTQLRELDIQFLQPLDVTAVERFLASAPHIQVLDMSNCNLEDGGFPVHPKWRSSISTHSSCKILF